MVTYAKGARVLGVEHHFQITQVRAMGEGRIGSVGEERGREGAVSDGEGGVQSYRYHAKPRQWQP